MSATTQTDDKRAKVEVNVWGEIFKNRENFVEMHIC